MFVRLLASAALAGGFAALPAEPDPVSPVTTLKYRIGIAALSTIDLSAFGAGEQKSSAGFTGYFTMTLKDTSGGQALTILLDSMTIDSASPPPARTQLEGTAASSKGAIWTGLLTKDGKIENLVAVGSAAQSQQFETVLMGFFPRGAAHTRRQGEAWSDTLSYVSTSESGTLSLRITTNFTAAGEGMYRGAKAFTINTTSTTASSASNVSENGETQFEGTGSGVGAYYVTKDGRYLGGTNTVTGDITITTSQAPMPIPGTIQTIVTISSL
jgi:hypothetical protein